MDDLLTPSEIAETTFPESQYGYDKSRVDAFVRTIAKQMEHLERQLEIAEQKATRPYLAAGKEMGDLLQHAHEVAAELKRSNEVEAQSVLQEAKKVEKRAQDEGAALKRTAQKEADDIVLGARETVERARAKVSEMLRAAEAESSVMKIEAQRESKQIRDDAKAQASELKAKADAKVADATHDIEKRVRQLQDAESILRRRIQVLADRFKALQARSLEIDREPDEELSFTDEPEEAAEEEQPPLPAATIT